MAISNQSNYFVHILLRARDWQHRPQFDQVCDWWQDGGRGVCALVGMGGAGKTAVAERFLNELLDDNSTTRQRVNPPPSVFVYSFYDDDKPENFFRHLQIWLEGDSTPDKPKSPTQLMFDIQQRQGLIILDGLEKVQESGARGGFGRLTSPSLRDLLNHIASGSARELSVLVTSRFPLTDLRDSQPRFFHTLPVDQIDVAAAIALLRDCGVRGTDMQLAPIVEHCGRHALTIDLAGGYIKEYGHGDPSTPLNLGDDLDKTVEEREAEADEELDDDRRAVLKQGIRFARIAQRYREAMLSSDEAALALLERICLFRLGVDCETLAAIFTGPDAEKVSGKALASLNAEQLQRILDWLVRMRIVERSETSSPKPENSKLNTPYTIHPAVRDGFLSGINRETAQASHDAVRDGLERSLPREPITRLAPAGVPTARLGGRPGGQYPSDQATLDLLEEIVHHTLHSGHIGEAWDIYWNRIGGYRNLGWHLGDYERGRRICESFENYGWQQSQTSSAGQRSVTQGLEQTKYLEPTHSPQNEPDDLSSPTGPMSSADMDPSQLRQILHDDARAAYLNEYALYLSALGELDRAIQSYQRHIETRRQLGPILGATKGYQNLAAVYRRIGHLREMHEVSQNALGLAEEMSDHQQQHGATVCLSHAHTLQGNCEAALQGFRRIVVGLSKNMGALRFGQLLLRMGRNQQASAFLQEVQENLQNWGNQNDRSPRLNVWFAHLHCSLGDYPNALSSILEAREWASSRNSRDILCLCAVIWAPVQLARVTELDKSSALSFKTSAYTVTHHAHIGHSLVEIEVSISEGLKIARDSGYALYHIDLLIQRARLHLLRGDAVAALDDIKVALDTGIPANEKTGQVELLAANHEQCGYAWASPIGLQLRAEALLLQAAQQLGSDSFVPARINELPTNVTELIDQARQCLQDALELWQPLHDPEPERPDQNFQLDGKEYNYRAEDTHQVLVDLEGGVLTQHPLAPIAASPRAEPKSSEDEMSKRFNVALSFPGEHRGFVLEVAEALADKLSRDRVFYDEWYEVDLLGAGGDLKLQGMYEDADLVVPFFSEFYDKPWCSMEWETIRGILLDRRKDDAVVPVHLDDTNVAGWSAVNFGIRLRGRTPVQIADIILQALEQRKSGASSATSAAASAATVSPASKPTQAASSPSMGALALWQEKLDYLQQQEAITADAAQRFALKKQIEEAQQKIRELGG